MKKDKIAKVMHEYKMGDLSSSSGKKVTSRKQAAAIAMSKAGVPKKRKRRGGMLDSYSMKD